jgi:hypothetical protein
VDTLICVFRRKAKKNAPPSASLLLLPSAVVPLLLFRCGVSSEENPDGNCVWPGEVLHGDHQLMRPARFAAPPVVCRR